MRVSLTLVLIAVCAAPARAQSNQFLLTRWTNPATGVPTPWSTSTNALAHGPLHIRMTLTSEGDWGVLYPFGKLEITEAHTPAERRELQQLLSAWPWADGMSSDWGDVATAVAPYAHSTAWSSQSTGSFEGDLSELMVTIKEISGALPGLTPSSETVKGYGQMALPNAGGVVDWVHDWPYWNTQLRIGGSSSNLWWGPAAFTETVTEFDSAGLGSYLISNRAAAAGYGGSFQSRIDDVVGRLGCTVTLHAIELAMGPSAVPEPGRDNNSSNPAVWTGLDGIDATPTPVLPRLKLSDVARVNVGPGAQTGPPGLQPIIIPTPEGLPDIIGGFYGEPMAVHLQTDETVPGEYGDIAWFHDGQGNFYPEALIVLGNGIVACTPPSQAVTGEVWFTNADGVFYTPPENFALQTGGIFVNLLVLSE